MNRSKLFYAVKNVIDSGCSVEFGKLCICNLGDYVPLRGDMERKYQVHCDDPRMRWSEVYYKEDVAIDKFMLIRSVIGDFDGQITVDSVSGVVQSVQV